LVQLISISFFMSGGIQESGVKLKAVCSLSDVVGCTPNANERGIAEMGCVPPIHQRFLLEISRWWNVWTRTRVEDWLVIECTAKGSYSKDENYLSGDHF